MNQYAIADSKQTSLLADYPIFSGNRPKEALKKYLSSINENIEFEVSGDRDCRFGVIPCTFENGRMYILGYKRKTWFRKKIQSI
jgi:hypothetical protein